MNGREALEALGRAPFDLMLLDIEMPDINGYQVLESLHADPLLPAASPVIVLSASDDAPGVARCIEMGAEDYLPKPFDPVLLQARLTACLEKKRLRDREQMHLRHIRAEQDRAERLLLNILPPAIAERLKQGEQAIADNFADATVLFGDLVGFTSLTAETPAAELVSRLNEIFSAFDQAVAELGLERSRRSAMPTWRWAACPCGGPITPRRPPTSRCACCGKWSTSTRGLARRFRFGSAWTSAPWWRVSSVATSMPTTSGATR